jgi:hypothetical protein
MAYKARIGAVRIEVDGHWDLSDLLALSESLSESYGLFYPLVAQDDDVRVRLYDQLRKTFWSGDIETRHIGRVLYQQIPLGESLKLRSFSYASPGVMEIGGVLGCLWMLSKVARGFIKGGSEFIDLWSKVDKFFEKRKDLRKPKRKIALDSQLAVSSDEARDLCFVAAEKLGFDPVSCNTIIAIVGNPFAALKYFVAIGNEGRKLSDLEKAKLLRLPELTDESITIPAAPKSRSRQIMSGGVVVQKTRRRPRAPDK